MTPPHLPKRAFWLTQTVAARLQSNDFAAAFRPGSRRRHWLHVVPGLLTLLGCLSTGLTAYAAGTNAADELVFDACTIDDPSGRQQLHAECTSVRVLENPDDQASRLINLRLVRVKSRDSNPQTDPLTLIAGGPGQSAAESFALLQRIFETVRTVSYTHLTLPTTPYV